MDSAHLLLRLGSWRAEREGRWICGPQRAQANLGAAVGFALASWASVATHHR